MDRTLLANAIKKVLAWAEKEILKTLPQDSPSRQKGKRGGVPILRTDVKFRKTYYTNEQQIYN